MFSIWEGYRIQITKSDCSGIAKLGNVLKSLGYSETGESFQNWIGRSDVDVEAQLRLLDETLHAEFGIALAVHKESSD